MRSLKILIAEDDEQNQAMLRIILNRRGHEVKSVWNGLQALEAVKTEPFDVLLMDVQMPELDGLEATRRIRQWEEKGRHLPIVILTGSLPLHTSETYKAAGADTFLSKPFDIKRLDMLLNVLGSETIDAEPSATIYDKDIAVDGLPVLDGGVVDERFGADGQMYRELLSEFLRGLPERVENISQALKEHQWESVSLLAHNLKGVAANFGAQRLSVFAHRLDDAGRQEKSGLALKHFGELRKHLAELDEAAKKITGQN